MTIRQFKNVPCTECKRDTLHNQMRCTECGNIIVSNANAYYARRGKIFAAGRQHVLRKASGIHAKEQRRLMRAEPNLEFRR